MYLEGARRYMYLDSVGRRRGYMYLDGVGRRRGYMYLDVFWMEEEVK